ncbi:MAG: ATP-binding protein, partial [Psychrosphaera sp.]|nr:ATP-binding protein [Psychrosphaera sp.]
LVPGANTVIGVNQGSNAFDSLSAVNIKHIIQDKSGTLWFATVQSGLVKLKAQAMLFEHHLGAINAGVRIRSIYADSQGKVWLGALTSLYGYDAGLQQFKPVLPDVGIVTAITEDKDHQIVMNVSDKGILKYNPMSGSVMPYADNGAVMPSNNLHSLTLDSDGTLWAGLYRSDDNVAGLFSYDKSQGKYVQHLNQFTVESILPLENQVLVGTRNGLRVMDRATGQWSVIRDDQHDLNRIWQIYQDSAGRIWVASNVSGLVLLDLPTKKMTFFTDEQGLPVNTVRAVSEDQQGMLWLGTTKGIVKFDPESFDVTVFTAQDGLRVDSVYPRMSTVTPSGDIIMANASAVSRFSPALLAASKTQKAKRLPLLLSQFKLFNQPVPIGTSDSPLSATINHTNTLALSYLDYWFSIAFASSDHNSGERIRYAWKMEGLTSQWVETDSNNRVASFISAPAGDYTFKVKASDADGQFGDDYRAVSITITPPLWQTWQAKLLYTLAALAFIYMLYYYRTRSLVNRAKVLERSVEARTATINQLMTRKEQIFANISHEFKTPLTLILTPLESVLSTELQSGARSKIKMAIRNGQRLLRMVEQLLELSRLDTFTEQKSHYYSLQQTLSVLLTSFEPLLQDKQLIMDCPSFDDVVVPSTADALEMILINLISNAIKYTPANGKLSIIVEPDLEKSSVVITVIDTGIGISEQDQQLVFNRFTRAEIVHDENIPGAGIGLALVKE